jgi:hypothetical protein
MLRLNDETKCLHKMMRQNDETKMMRKNDETKMMRQK